MNIYYFIAQRVGNAQKRSFSAIIVKIAIAGIALGLATILVAFAILFGFQKNIQDKLFSFNGHMTITKRGLNNSYEESPISTNTNLYKNFDKIPSIEQLHVYGRKPGILKANSEVLGVVFKGIGRDYAQEKFRDNMIAGRFIEFSDKGYSREIIISQKIADKLGLALEDTIPMFFVQDPPRFRRLIVKGIYQTGMEEFDEKLIIGDINLVRRLNNWGDTLAGGYEIFVRNFSDLEEIAIPEVLNAMNYEMELYPITSQHLDIFDWLGLLNQNVVLFLGLILVVSSFNMISILLIMIMERVQMIGIMKAIGATNWQIRQIFFYQGLRLAFIGMGWGNLIGLGLSALQYYFKIIPLDAENYYMNAVPIDWNWSAIIALNILTLIIIALILLLPTYIISRIRPVKAIRFN